MAYRGGEHSSQKHFRWDRRHPAHLNNPGTAQNTSLASVVSGKLFRSRCGCFLAFGQIWKENVAEFGDFQLEPPKLAIFSPKSIPPQACDAAFLSSTAHAATALSIAAPHLHPFAAPNSAALEAWRCMHSPFPDHCLPPADCFSAPAVLQLAHLPTHLRRALHAVSHVEMLCLWPTDRARALVRCDTDPNISTSAC
jgi:hypothetical protein